MEFDSIVFLVRLLSFVFWLFLSFVFVLFYSFLHLLISVCFRSVLKFIGSPKREKEFSIIIWWLMCFWWMLKLEWHKSAGCRRHSKCMTFCVRTKEEMMKINWWRIVNIVNIFFKRFPKEIDCSEFKKRSSAIFVPTTVTTSINITSIFGFAPFSGDFEIRHSR